MPVAENGIQFYFYKPKLEANKVATLKSNFKDISAPAWIFGTREQGMTKYNISEECSLSYVSVLCLPLSAVNC